VIGIHDDRVSATIIAAIDDELGRAAGRPHFSQGDLPKGVPPRRGTPEYDAWQKKRAEEAATIKSK
jgi:hypothetical protein